MGNTVATQSTHRAAGVAEMDEDQWLTTPEVATLLRVSVRTVHDWRQSRIGPPAYRVGRRLLWKRHEVDLWVRAQTSGQLAAASR
jgi:excisionase family DNA binding protein